MVARADFVPVRSADLELTKISDRAQNFCLLFYFYSLPLRIHRPKSPNKIRFWDKNQIPDEEVAKKYADEEITSPLDSLELVIIRFVSLFYASYKSLVLRSQSIH